MLEIDGYSKLEPLHRGSRSFVLRAERAEDGLPVILKTPAADFPSSNDFKRLRHEYELGRNAGVGPARTHVVRHLALAPAGSSLALVLEDFGGRSLAGAAQDRGL